MRAQLSPVVAVVVVDPLELIEALRDWFVSHIKKTDLELARFLTAKPQGTTGAA